MGFPTSRVTHAEPGTFGGSKYPPAQQWAHCTKGSTQASREEILRRFTGEAFAFVFVCRLQVVFPFDVYI